MSKETGNGEACHHCHTEMKLIKVKKYPGYWPAVIVVTGVLCSLLLTGALIGIPLILIGLYMATAQETIRHCQGCGHYFKVRTDVRDH